MKHNLGIVDRILRFALAFWWLGPFSPNYAAPWAQWLILLIGWVSLIESFIAWCPLHDLLGISTKNH